MCTQVFLPERTFAEGEPCAQLGEDCRLHSVIKCKEVASIRDVLTGRQYPTEIRDYCVARGVLAHFILHNAFLDARLFSIWPDASKIYDAVYSARMAPFKRHELAQEIPSLLIIGGRDSWLDPRFTRVVADDPQ